MKVLVLGASGMAGHVVSLYLREKGYDVDTLSDRQKIDKSTYLIDVTNKKIFEDFVKNTEYDTVINCIGILVKQSQERKDLAVYINSYLPLLLEKHYKGTQTKIIHLSSDGVFGNKKTSYDEKSVYDGEGFYDRTKALGEIINDKDLTFRMSIIGPELTINGVGLFNWFFQQTGEISGYNKVMWGGITTIELSKAIKEALEQGLTGVYHLIPGSTISKFDLLKLLKKEFNRGDIEIAPKTDVISKRMLVNTRNDFHFTVPDFPEMIKEMRAWIESHKDLYPHYKIN